MVRQARAILSVAWLLLGGCANLLDADFERPHGVGEGDAGADENAGTVDDGGDSRDGGKTVAKDDAASSDGAASEADATQTPPDPVASLTSGGTHSCVLYTDQSLRCWGNNTSGALGDGTTTTPATPVAVTLPGAASWVSAGDLHTCAGGASGTWCWGYDSDGQLGNGAAGATKTPSAVVAGLAASAGATGASHSCVIGATGLWCFGGNAYGSLGFDSGGTCVPAHASTKRMMCDAPAPGFVDALGNVTDVSAMYTSTCAVANGAVACFGGGSCITTGSNAWPCSAATPRTVTLSRAAARVRTSQATTCAIDVAGEAYCWGENDLGQLGAGTSTDSATPVRFLGVTDVVDIALGAKHTCVLGRDGRIRCSGNNDRGQLGDGTLVNRLLGVEVQGLTSAKHISAGRDYTCASLVDGAVYCWGNGASGRLGAPAPSLCDGTPCATTPVRVLP